MKLRLLFVLALAGCYSPSFENGKSQCGPAGQCPDDFFCAPDNHCWQNGTTPGDLSVADMEVAVDMMLSCNANEHICSGACVSNTSVLTCGGTSCTPCPVPANGASSTCDGTSCGFTCTTGFHVCGDSCL